MFDDPRDELSPAEQEAFDALPREQQPPPSLEERTVAMLRGHGHLATPIGAARPRRRSGLAIRWSAPWIAGAAAASLAIFASGVAVGQYVGTRNAALVIDANARGSAAELAGHVQRAGSLYVAALASLSQLPDSGSEAPRDSARIVALRVLGEAAQEIALLAPDDPLAVAVLRGLNQRSRDQYPTAPSRSVVWY
jgi:hypothetical protein